MFHRIFVLSAFLLAAAGSAWAETKLPFAKGADIKVYTASKVFSGKLQDSSAKDWVHLTDDATKADVWIPLRAVEAVSKSRPAPESTGRAPGGPPAEGRKKYVVYVHGICRHDPGYSDGWWAAMRPFTPDIPDNNRKEVLWSDIISPGPGGPAEAGGPGAGLSEKNRSLTSDIQDELRDRAVRQRTDVGGEPMEGPGGLGDTAQELTQCVSDFSLYLLNRDIRNRVIDRFNQVVKPILQQDNAEVEVISHSWGTVVAYEALRLMDGDPSLHGRVRNLFTVGSALSIPQVKSRLLPEAADGRRPKGVQRWVNLNARFDIVGGALKGRPFAVDDEFLGLPPVGCSNFIPNPTCAHGSYFVPENVRVNRDIFGRFIEELQSQGRKNRAQPTRSFARRSRKQGPELALPRSSPSLAITRTGRP
ncbi:MAG: hypothetical protein JO112_06790 [Planctomycetes bacterium]|nr:hypothetical protein [Planctomycetota bacterium]